MGRPPQAPNSLCRGRQQLWAGSTQLPALAVEIAPDHPTPTSWVLPGRAGGSSSNTLVRPLCWRRSPAVPHRDGGMCTQLPGKASTSCPPHHAPGIASFHELLHPKTRLRVLEPLRPGALHSLPLTCVGVLGLASDLALCLYHPHLCGGPGSSLRPGTLPSPPLTCEGLLGLASTRHYAFTTPHLCGGPGSSLRPGALPLLPLTCMGTPGLASDLELTQPAQVCLPPQVTLVAFPGARQAVQYF